MTIAQQIKNALEAINGIGYAHIVECTNLFEFLACPKEDHAQGCLDIGVEMDGDVCGGAGGYEQFSFSWEDGIIQRDDFTGSAIWGNLSDGSFQEHAAKAFLPSADWLNRNGEGDF
jgi:hypothetical protein